MDGHLKNTNDSRESASIYLARQLLNDMAYINVYDPMVSEKESKEISRKYLKMII